MTGRGGAGSWRKHCLLVRVIGMTQRKAHGDTRGCYVGDPYTLSGPRARVSGLRTKGARCLENQKFSVTDRARGSKYICYPSRARRASFPGQKTDKPHELSVITGQDPLLEEAPCTSYDKHMPR